MPDTDTLTEAELADPRNLYDLEQYARAAALDPNDPLPGNDPVTWAAFVRVARSTHAEMRRLMRPVFEAAARRHAQRAKLAGAIGAVLGRIE